MGRLLLMAMLALYSAPLAVFAQEDVSPYALRKHGVAVGGHIGSNGMGLDVSYTHRIDKRWEHLAYFTIASLKDKHEQRISPFHSDAGGRKYIFDKLNYTYVLAAMYGVQGALLHLDAQNKITWQGGLAAGPNIALLKPYYVDVVRQVGSETKIVPEPYNSKKMTYYEIIGESDFFQGTEQISAQPGLSFLAYSSINFAGSTLRIRTVQLGVRADYFFNPPAIMDTQPNQNLYLCGFVALMIGNSW